MLCSNCGKNNANVKYTQIINGVKKEMMLCEKCAKELGIENQMDFDMSDFNMPINFSSFLSNFFDDYAETSLLPNFTKTLENKCNTCGLTYNDFVKTGKFGCPDCYNTFEARIDYLTKKLHGSSNHIGRKTKNSIDNNIKISKKSDEKLDEKSDKLLVLQKDLKLAIKEERYEDAANIRDEINKINKKK